VKAEANERKAAMKYEEKEETKMWKTQRNENQSGENEKWNVKACEMKSEISIMKISIINQ